MYKIMQIYKIKYYVQMSDSDGDWAIGHYLRGP